MQNLFRKASYAGWTPDADAINGPEGSLLRGDNLVDDRTGSMTIRLGSEIVYEDLVGDDAHSIRTVVLADGNTHRIVGVGDRVYDNGTDFGADFDGEGDVAMGDDSYQVFMARGETRKKFDGTDFHEWAISAPDVPADVESADAIVGEVAIFDSTGEVDSPSTGAGAEFVTNEGSSTFIPDFEATADSALQLTPDSGTGRASCSKIYTAPQDYFNVGGASGSDTDLFDIRTWIENPRVVDKVTIMFGLNEGDDPFVDDYYYFDFPIRNAQTVDIKSSEVATKEAYRLSADKSIESLAPEDVTQVRTPEDASRVLSRLGRLAGPRSRERQDPQQASPAWGHLSVSRGDFNRVGGTADLSWETVTGFKIVYTVTPGQTAVLALDAAQWIGGGDLALTGTFKFAYRFIRDTGTYIEMSPLSPISEPVTLNQQSVEITIPSAALAGADPQVNQVWIYMYSLALAGWYRVAVTGSTSNASSQKMDEFAQTADGALDAADRTRLVNQGLSIPGFTPDQGIVLQLRKSEQQAAADNELLEPGAVGPPEGIVAIAGPWRNRMFVLTSEGWLYPSLQTTPSNFSVYHAVDLRRYGTPLWMVEANGEITCGFTKDVVRVAGTGDESEDRANADLYGEPLNVGNPPVDRAVYTDGNAILYRAADGLMSLTGVGLVALSQGQTSLLWRGQNRHGVQPLNIVTGRFRLTVDNGLIFLLAPEGSGEESGPAVWRYSLRKQTWNRTYYPWNLRSIFREPNGDLVAGTDDGKVVRLESGSQDDGADIPVEVRTIYDDGGGPLAQKDPHDLQIHCNTGAKTGTASLFLDGNNGSADASFSFMTQQLGIARVNLLSVGDFVRCQLRLTGSFHTFALHGFNISYRALPQHAMALDTGYIVPQNGGDLAWLNEAEIDCKSPSDLELLVYKDDVLYRTLDVAVSPNVRKAYRVVLPKGTKSSRLRFELQTTAVDGEGEIGFECFGIKVWPRPTGNQKQNGPWTVYPAGQSQ